MRVIVTGSRNWKDGSLVRAKLQDCLDACTGGDRLVVVHGGCRSGGDAYADGWARWQHRHHAPCDEPEVHHARWEQPCRPDCRSGHRRADPRGWDVCPVAGFNRNEAMVALGADVCLAFLADESRASVHCAGLAERAGIHTIPFRPAAAGLLAA